MKKSEKKKKYGKRIEKYLEKARKEGGVMLSFSQSVDARCYQWVGSGNIAPQETIKKMIALGMLRPNACDLMGNENLSQTFVLNDEI